MTEAWKTLRPARGLGLLVAAALALTSAPARAADLLVAVAANFLDAAEALEPGFEASTGHDVAFAAGSTGKLYAQILSGAPYDVFLSADAARPADLAAQGLAEPDSVFTYATGRLALWSADAARIGPDGAATLARGDFRTLAIANPELAPYGLAARETLAALGLWDAVAPKIVMGQNIGQTFALVATGNADLGFVALAALRSPATDAAESGWIVPETLHGPIRQDAALIRRGIGNPAAAAFLDYLQSDEARAVIAHFGYGD